MYCICEYNTYCTCDYLSSSEIEPKFNALTKWPCLLVLWRVLWWFVCVCVCVSVCVHITGLNKSYKVIALLYSDLCIDKAIASCYGGGLKWQRMTRRPFRTLNTKPAINLQVFNIDWTVWRPKLKLQIASKTVVILWGREQDVKNVCQSMVGTPQADSDIRSVHRFLSPSPSRSPGGALPSTPWQYAE